MTQRNTANAEESAAASEELAAQARSMQETLNNFTLPEDKDKRRPAAMQKSFAAKTYGNQDTGSAEQEMLPHMDPNDLISLDDRDFGKY